MLHVLIRKARSAVVRLRRFFVSAKFGFSPDVVYKNEFYCDGGFSKTEETARTMTSYLYDQFRPTSVLDLGCGMGNYLKYFAERGCRAVGVEGSSAGVSRVPESVIAFQHDLRKPLGTNQKFDLVMSVEVAEHIPKKYSRNLVSSVCRHARDVIVFTAAPPGTPGQDHINCQDQSFWDDLFANNGFFFDRERTKALRQHAIETSAAQWFQEWAFVYVSQHAESTAINNDSRRGRLSRG